MGDEVLQALGRIEGKVDQLVDAAREHREDDVRRFTDVYEKLAEHAKDINQAKGGKAVIMWLIGGGLVSIIASVTALAKVLSR